MKKRILAMLLSALLVANISACNFVPENEFESKTGTESSESDKTNAPNDTENTIEDISETNTETRPTWKGPNFCNGASGNSDVTYIFNQNGEFSVHIADWAETHLFTSFADEDINAVKYSATAIGVNNERAFLLLKRSNKITVVSFKKGFPNEMVINLDVDEDVYKISGNFINENVGYLFAFKEVSEDHAVGGSKLSNLFKTEDGGKTWDSINVQNVPSISLRNYISFAKMISEDVGLISGGIGPADYDFCKRTLLTTDGGLNWVNVNIPELPENDDLPWAIVTDFTQIDESYILTIRYGIPEGTHVDAKYKLLDLNTWVRIS